MWFSQKHFSIWTAMGWMSIAAVFCAAALTDNEWLRASLGSITSAMIVNAMLQAIFTRGEQRAFALSFFLGAVFFGPSLYTAIASLPYLLTMRLVEVLKSMGMLSGSDSQQNFLILATIFWLQFVCYASGFTGRYWYRRTQQADLAGHPEQPKPAENSAPIPSATQPDPSGAS